MKKTLKIFGLLLLPSVLIAGFLTYVKIALPDVGVAEDIKIESTPETR